MSAIEPCIITGNKSTNLDLTDQFLFWDIVNVLNVVDSTYPVGLLVFDSDTFNFSHSFAFTGTPVLERIVRACVRPCACGPWYLIFQDPIHVLQFMAPVLQRGERRRQNWQSIVNEQIMVGRLLSLFNN